MAAPTAQEINALTAAIELLRRAVNDSAAFTLVNLARAGGGGRTVGNGGPSYEAVRKGIESGGVGEATAGAVPVVIVGTRNAPIPVNVVGGKAEYEQDQLIKSWLDEQRELNKTPPRPGGGPAPEKAGEAIGLTLAKRFGMIVAPLASLHTVLSQTTSGMGVFRKSLDLLGSSVAPLLLPVFVLLATGMTLLSEVIFNKLLPTLDKWYSRVASGDFGQAAAKEYKGLIDAENDRRAKQDLPAMTDDERKTFSRQTVVGNKLAPVIGGGVTNFGLGWLFGGRSPAAAGATPAAKPAGSPPASRFDAAMKDVLKSLQLSMGPKASYAGLTEVGKSAQLAALNQDPLEARMLRMQQQIFELLVRHFGQPDKPDTGTQTFQR